MEFVCNRINLKTVAATLTVAFFAGRVNLFGGVFPAAIAFLTVMLAVSTIYIYTLPVMAGAMCLSEGQRGIWGMAEIADPYGDVAALIICGLFFLFFHSHKPSLNQRTAAAAAITCASRWIYAAAAQNQDLASPQLLIAETVALAIYIRAFNSAATVLLAPAHYKNGTETGKTKAEPDKARTAGKTAPPALTELAREKAGFSLAVLAVSAAGSIGAAPAVFTLWFLLIAWAACCRDATCAIVISAICDIFWKCSQGTSSSVFTSLFMGLIAARFLVALFPAKYRKYVLAAILLTCVLVTTKTFNYSIAVSMGIFVLIPTDFLGRCWYIIESVITPEEFHKEKRELMALSQCLRRKREVYGSLSRILSQGNTTQKVMACQFQALARVADSFLNDSRRSDLSADKLGGTQLQVAAAGYAMGRISGDSTASFTFGGNKQGLIISDGMGKGPAAAPTSQMVVSTLSKFLEADFDVDLALRTVNELLLAENDGEMFASLDLTIINRSSRRAHIFKMGAASTFICHEGKVAIIKKPAPPVGVDLPVRLEYLDIKLARGDVLVMVSDGITDCDRNDRECSWLTERLSEIGSRDPGIIAELIINKAVEKYGIKERDDLTVLVAVV